MNIHTNTKELIQLQPVEKKTIFPNEMCFCGTKKAKSNKTGFKEKRAKVIASVRNALTFKYLPLNWLCI